MRFSSISVYVPEWTGYLRDSAMHGRGRTARPKTVKVHVL